nr:hypothetical protein [Tanacetum cinerariifolium]
MYKLDLVILAPKDKKNKETHIYYLKHTMEQAGILRKIVEQAKSLNPLDSASYATCNYVKPIQELLGYIRDTCPDIHKPSERLAVITPINNKKIVSFSEPITTTCSTSKSVRSPKTQDKPMTNNYVYPSIGVNGSTESCKSKSKGNTRNDKISQTLSSNLKKNKVEAYHRIAKPSLHKMNYVVEPTGNACVLHSKLNENSKLMCVKCNGCMFDANHDLCFLEYVHDVNDRSKTKSVKKNKKKEIWKPTGKVFNYVGYKWRPIGRILTIVGNKCPLTRLTSTKVMPPKEPIHLEIVAQKPVVTRVYTRRPMVPKAILDSKPNIVKSLTANKKEPDMTQGSNTLVAPSSSSVVNLRLSKLFCGI